MHVRMMIRELFTATATIQQIKMGSDVQRTFCTLHLLLLLLLVLLLMLLLLHWIIQNQRVDDDECHTHFVDGGIDGPKSHFPSFPLCRGHQQIMNLAADSLSFKVLLSKLIRNSELNLIRYLMRFKLKSISNLLLLA